MKKQIIKLLIKVAALSIIIVAITIIYFIYDPFKVLYKYQTYYESGKQSVVMLNRDYVSTETFINNYPYHHYDSFIFGSSRTFFFQVSDWEKYIQSKNCFHFNAAAETLYGIDKKINYLKNTNIKIKNVLIAFDNELLQGVTDSKHIISIKHPILSGKSVYLFQLEYLKAFFDINFFQPYLAYKLFNINSKSLDNSVWDYDNVSNELSNFLSEQLILKNKEEYYLAKKDLFYKRDTIQKTSNAVINEPQKILLNEISKNLKSDSTNIKIFINPLYNQVKFNQSDLEYLESLFGKENVFDFSGINDITNNIYNYYEVYHYRPNVAKLIVDELYKKEMTQ